ncbi:hypothetical protein CROQUDRAFT_102431 [Cronartium quercuum f. sp. fusiforme G11]|uniref:Uncharacterized protein n=1 Tax=Cronartium quercuum f. sp. fusiforme G11 TaxID=708437 RepID=A0A9P6N7W1_9BASI|nr:hypothetical protein CROQUDRAFT_102431 [Cronartium quercuum f. sp. fusiforme G11]
MSLASRPHTLPLKPASWASVTGWAVTQMIPRPHQSAQPPPPPPVKTINEFKASVLVIWKMPDQNPFEGMPVSQIVQNVNKALESIGAVLDDQPVWILVVAVLKPSGDIKITLLGGNPLSTGGGSTSKPRVPC